MAFPEALNGCTSIIHHKALNSRENFKLSIDIAERFSDHVHVFEGDLCWHNYPDRAHTDFYFFHQRFLFDDLSPKARKKWLRSGKSLDFEPTLKSLPKNVLAIIELKLGRGDTQMAFQHMLSGLERTIPGRFWVDGFSVEHLRMIKNLSPTTPISVHTERVKGDHIVTTLPRWPFLYKTHIDDLNWIDAVSVRHWENFESIEKAAKLVHSKGKSLFISRILNAARWEQCQKLGARGGYFEMEDIADLTTVISES